MSKSKYKDRIIELNKQGLSENEIIEILQCSRGLISYHLNDEYRARHKEKSRLLKKKTRADEKEELVNKFGGKCQICSYLKCHHALNFHHLIKEGKKFAISDSICRFKKSTKELEEELKKCILICSNCHAEIHAGVAEIPEKIFKLPLTS